MAAEETGGVESDGDLESFGMQSKTTRGGAGRATIYRFNNISSGF
jgi:hypothetical protein